MRLVFGGLRVGTGVNAWDDSLITSTLLEFFLPELISFTRTNRWNYFVDGNTFTVAIVLVLFVRFRCYLFSILQIGREGATNLQCAKWRTVSKAKKVPIEDLSFCFVIVCVYARKLRQYALNQFAISKIDQICAKQLLLWFRAAGVNTP